MPLALPLRGRLHLVDQARLVVWWFGAAEQWAQVSPLGHAYLPLQRHSPPPSDEHDVGHRARHLLALCSGLSQRFRFRFRPRHCNWLHDSDQTGAQSAAQESLVVVVVVVAILAIDGYQLLEGAH